MRAIAIVISLVLLIGCSNAKETTSDNDCRGGEFLKLIDLTGLDGCGLVFEQQNGDRLEPLNLSAYSIELEVGETYQVLYKVRSDAMSVCMVGQTIEILCIQKKADK